jgi:signal transduction histidine kinase
LVLPIAIGSLRLLGERMGLYDTEFGVSIFTLTLSAVFLSMIASSARVILEFDRERAQLLVREQEARMAAEGANLAKSNFLAVMSHELRTPLAAIIGYEELLADGITGPVNDAQRHQLGRVKASAQHLLQIIDQILSYARIDAGREIVHPVDVDADELADDAASLIEPLATEKGLRLVVNPLDYQLPLSTDAGKVRQILVNLLANAVKFTPRGNVTLTVQHKGATVQYVVSDTGVGIASEHLEQIFEPFWQVESAATRRAGGTGLGLSVTRRLARMLGGDVTVESSIGYGSTFTVTLPLESSI